MSKSDEVLGYISETGSNKDDLLKLEETSRIIYGDFLNPTSILKSGIALMPKTGIFIIEDDYLFFYGSKSFLRKELLMKFKYEDISALKNVAFTIAITLKSSFAEKGIEYKFNISWEDYISNRIKSSFIKSLNEKRNSSLIKKGIELLNEGNNSEYAYFYYNRIFSEKLFDENFIELYAKFITFEASKSNSEHSNIYYDYIATQKKYLLDIYPSQADIIEKYLIDANIILDANKSDNFYDKFLNYVYVGENDDIKIDVKMFLDTPAVRKLISLETTKQVENIKKRLNAEFQGKMDNFLERIGFEKNVYREIIKDNILGNQENLLSKEDLKVENLIDNLLDFYYRYKILNEYIPDSFTIDRLKPDDGFRKFIFIIESMARSYLKIVDPYLFGSELDFFFNIPSNINITIITYAVSKRSFKDKLKEFEEKIEKLRESRFGKVKVRLLKFKGSEGTPLHDRAIFSQDWGVSLSNSLSQVGRKHDIVVSRIFDPKDREVSDFDDYWYMRDEIYYKGKKHNVAIFEI